ncbi:hypothetical protein [Kitasatospora sp. McL0602]|uniref:hypothetical protein n=1 Tax=Kitasatospora sp. McL0602 TaxID=3439530 RepID=UPI003F88CFDC
MKSKQTALALLAAAVVASAAAGCGGSSGGTSRAAASGPASTSASTAASTAASASGSASASAAGSPNGVEGLAAKEIVSKSAQALKDAGAAKVTGQVTDGGQQTTLDLRMDTAANCSGTMGLAGQGSFQLVKQGTQLWIKPDQAFWQSHGGPATAQLVGDKYLRTTSDNPDFADVASLCDLKQIADQVVSGPSQVSIGSQTTVDGQQALAVNGTDNDEKGTLYVALRGRPYPLRLEKTGNSPGKLDFKDFGTPVPTTTPSPDQSVDLDQLQKEVSATPTASV